MASLSTTNCKYVIVYTTDGTTLQVATATNGNIVLPANATINSVTDFSPSGSGCSISSTCNNLPTTTPTACYGCNWAINYDGGGISVGMTTFTIKGFFLNGVTYNINTPVTISGSDSSTTIAGAALLSSITSTPILNSIIQNVCLGNFNQNGSRGADVALIFKGIPSFMTSSFLYGNYNGGIEPVNITDVYIPIVTFSNLESGAQTACPCS